jgi:heme-degrading monooxygenase HmoA
MHARLQTVRALPDQFNSPEATAYLIEVLEKQPGFHSVHLMLQIGSRQGLNLTLWDSREDAEAAPARTRSVMGPRQFPLDHDEVYDVVSTAFGSTALKDATVCQVTWFGGPLSAAQVEAMRRAGEERIRPAVERVPGFVATYVLCHPADSAVVVVTLATSTEALERITDAVFSTSLLPGEDPALLTDPDRVELYRVEDRSLAGDPVR